MNIHTNSVEKPEKTGVENAEPRKKDGNRRKRSQYAWAAVLCFFGVVLSYLYLMGLTPGTELDPKFVLLTFLFRGGALAFLLLYLFESWRCWKQSPQEEKMRRKETGEKQPKYGSKQKKTVYGWSSAVCALGLYFSFFTLAERAVEEAGLLNTMKFTLLFLIGTFVFLLLFFCESWRWKKNPPPEGRAQWEKEIEEKQRKYGNVQRRSVYGRIALACVLLFVVQLLIVVWSADREVCIFRSPKLTLLFWAGFLAFLPLFLLESWRWKKNPPPEEQARRERIKQLEIEEEKDFQPVSSKLLYWSGDPHYKRFKPWKWGLYGLATMNFNPLGWLAGYLTTKSLYKEIERKATFWVKYASGREGKETVPKDSTRYVELWKVLENQDSEEYF